MKDMKKIKKKYFSNWFNSEKVGASLMVELVSADEKSNRVYPCLFTVKKNAKLDRLDVAFNRITGEIYSARPNAVELKSMVANDDVLKVEGKNKSYIPKKPDMFD